MAVVTVAVVPVRVMETTDRIGFPLVAVVELLATFPALEIVASFVSAMAAAASMSAFTIPVTVALSTRVLSLVGVTTSPETKVLPLVTVAMVGKVKG